MKRAGKACVLAVLAAGAAGCRVEVSQSNVARVVNTALKTRRSSPSYSMDVQIWKGAGEGREVVRCSIEKDTANAFSYAFANGARYWSTPDGCVLVGPGGTRAEVFSGLGEPSEEELRTALHWGASRYIARHRVIAHFLTREGAWKGHRVSVTPLEPGPFDCRGEQFIDKRSGAKVFSVEYDERGRIRRERLAKSVRILRRGEFETPPLPEGCGVARLTPGRASNDAPGWGLVPDPTLEVLADPRGRHGPDLAVYDMSKGGFVFVLFERRTEEPPIVSPIAHSADVGGIEVSAWPVGEKHMYRWCDGGMEFSLLANMTPDIAWDFLVANLGAGRPLASRAKTGDVSPEGAVVR